MAQGEKGRLVSPNEMAEAAAEMMGISNPPANVTEQMIAVNFYCANTTILEAVQFMVLVLDFDVTKEQVAWIWDKQQEAKAAAA